MDVRWALLMLIPALIAPSFCEEPNLEGRRLTVNFELVLTNIEPTTAAPTTTPATTPAPTPAPSAEPEATAEATTEPTEEPTTVAEVSTTEPTAPPLLGSSEAPTSTELDSTDNGTGVLVPIVERFAREVELFAVTNEEDATIFPPSLLVAVEDWLEDKFDSSVGFLEVILKTDPWGNLMVDGVPIPYEVLYNVSALSANKSLNEAGFVASLVGISEKILADEIEIMGFFVDKELTETSMDEEISRVITTFGQSSSLCDEIGRDVCEDITNQCYQQDGSIICENKCTVYKSDINTQCATPDKTFTFIFLEGNCTVDKEGNAECQCGKTPGDILDNFFVGDRCLNAAFVVGIAAGVGGFIIIVFMGTIIGLAVKKRKAEERNQVYDAYKESSRDLLGLDEMEKSRSAPPNGNDTAFTNKGYEGFEPPADYHGVTQTELDNFKANLSHIDPKADYSIRRPSFKENSNHNGATGYNYESARL